MDKSNFFAQTTLGQTGLNVGRIGITSSFGAPSEVYEAAFERGLNYFSWGTFIKGRSKEMETAMKNIIKKGKRKDLILSMYAYAHNAYINKTILKKGLKSLGSDYADVMILGYSNKEPNQKLINGALKLREKGLIRHIGISSHNRKLIGKLIQEKVFDLYHFRYNAANRGAEQDIFPVVDGERKPGMVSYTATRWRQLLNPKNMPPGEEPLTAGDCYRFALSNDFVDMCLMGVKNMEMFNKNMEELEKGPLSTEEMARIKKIGDFVYGKKKF